MLMNLSCLVRKDEALRAAARKEAKIESPFLLENEEIVLSMFGMYWYSGGIYHNWRPGHFYVTNKRLVLFREMPPEILFETPYTNMKGMALRKERRSKGKAREELHVLLEGDEIARLHAVNTAVLKRAIEERLEIRGITLEKDPCLPAQDEVVTTFLRPGEEITHSGKMWHLITLPAPGREKSGVWKAGRLYLTDKRLCWRHGFDDSLAFETPPDSLMHVMVERRDPGGTLRQRDVLLVLHTDGQKSRVACFSGDEASLKGWEAAIAQTLRDRQAERGTETCPRCGRKASEQELLEEGCPRCGWCSPRALRRQAGGDGNGSG